MKNNLLTLASALMLVLFAVACAKNDGGGKTASTPAVTTTNKCAVGKRYTTQYGCLPINGCPANTAYYQNTCISISGTNTAGTCTAGQVYTYQGCLPQGNCPSGMGQYQNQCVMAINTQYWNNGMYGYGYGYNNYGNVYYPPTYLYQQNNYYYFQGYHHGYPYYYSPRMGAGLYFYLGLSF